MSQPIKKVISQVYELEGLLLLIQNHGENTDQFIYEMVREKSNTIAELVSTLSPEIFGNPAEKFTAQHTEFSNETEPASEPEKEGEKEGEPTFDLSEFDGVMLGADDSYDLDELEESEETEDDGDIEVEVIYEDEPEQAEELEGTETTETIEDDEDIEVEVIYEDEPEQAEKQEETETIEDNEEPIEFSEEPKPIEVEDEPLVEEQEQTTPPTEDCESVSVRKRFTLNDRFRFKRELFANSDVEMNSTLDLVDTMGSYAEAEDYFYNDMQWDSESSEVIDFMFIIRNHF